MSEGMPSDPGDERVEFIWTFPLYILARDYTIDPQTGGVVMDEHIRFPTPSIMPSGEPCVVVFTDLHAAEDYAEQIGQEFTLRALEMPGPAALATFLRAVQPTYRFVAVDMNPRTGRLRGFPIQLVLDWLDGLSAQDL